ncbi:MAG: AlpA family phage regulatory protein [Pseudolabrys sp.]|jgi:prophage regulatory protein
MRGIGAATLNRLFQKLNSFLLRTVLARTGLSRSTIYRKIAEGTFPAQFRISTNGTGWHESDIDRWIANPVAWRPRHEVDFND